MEVADPIDPAWSRQLGPRVPPLRYCVDEIDRELPDASLAGALANSLAIAALTPLTIYAFTFPLPYLGDAPSLGPQFALGSAILIAGLLTYNSPSLVPQVRTPQTPPATITAHTTTPVPPLPPTQRTPPPLYHTATIAPHTLRQLPRLLAPW